MKEPTPAPTKVETRVTEKPAPEPLIDYEKIKEESDKGLKELVLKRKKEFGVDKSVDMVVKSGEYIRVGKEIVPLDRILAQIEAQKKEQKASAAAPSQLAKPDVERIPPEIREPHRPMPAKPSQPATKLAAPSQLAKPDVKRIPPEIREPHRPMPAKPSQPATKLAAPSQPVRSDTERIPPEIREPHRPMPAKPAKRPASYYGVYVVRPGDNLWNIHFAFLREYFGSRDIRIPPDADEPQGSRSSGIGRILKYAETMVHIFNLKTGKLSTNLNLLEPREKIVIFNLSALDKNLKPLTYKQIDTIHFDGRNLILTEK
jgi:hypothetical protein